ncbi:MAG: UDP-N-acetylmuramate dehydrogenase [Bacillota bacterium]
MNIERELGQKLKAGVKVNEPMSLHTSWQVGGPADYFLCPADLDELIEIVRFRKKYDLPLYVIGNGTNILVRDGGIRGMVVNMGPAFCYINQEGQNLVAGSGTPMTFLARSAAEIGLSGLEFCVGIPGSVGGAIIMNAGSFGGYIGEWVHSVKLVTWDAEVLNLARNELSFGYRTSNLPGRGIVVEAVLQLKQGDSEESLKMMEHFLNERKQRHPDLPSAGSVFRNLPNLPAGKIIEETGCKGMKSGGAEVSCKHANFIVNTGEASAVDIIELIEKVKRLVQEDCGLELKPEVKIIGEEK